MTRKLPGLPTPALFVIGRSISNSYSRLRCLAGLVAVAGLSLFISAAQAQAPLSVSPTTVKAGTSPTLTVTSNGFFDLSQVRASQISISNSGVSNIQVIKATPQSLTFSFFLARNAAAVERSLSITGHGLSVSLRLNVEAAEKACRSSCRPPSSCENGKCVRPPPRRCNPPCGPREFCATPEFICKPRT